MTPRRILHLNKVTLLEILLLVNRLKDDEFDLWGYAETIRSTVNDEGVGLFGLYDDNGRMHGYLHVEEPVPYYPTQGFLIIAATTSRISSKDADKLFKAGKDFLTERGTEYIITDTEHSLRALRRRYSFYPAKQKLVVHPLKGDSYKRVIE